MTREPRIVMEKEVLTIGLGGVKVDYEFRNDTDEDVTTTVAFPIPPFKMDTEKHTAREQGFDDFKLTVEDEPVRFNVEVTAKLGRRDVTDVLRKYGVDAASFGHFDTERMQAKDIERLSADQRALLTRVGLIEGAATRYEGTWTVEKKYYWTQTFPAHGRVHIRHEYSPVPGNSNSVGGGTLVENGKAGEGDEELTSVCPTPDLLNALRQDTQRRHHLVSIEYVDFILTTANTWKRPIEDFTLNVERPPLVRDPNHPATGVNYVSFCWDGPIEKVDATHFRAHTTDFTPTKELRVGFLQGYLMGEY